MFATVLAAGIALLAGASPIDAAGGDTITQPAPVSLAPGGSTTLPTQTLHLDSSPPRADIVLAFDTTGSMGQAIVDAQSDASSIVGQIQQSIPGARFAVADFKDYDPATISYAPGVTPVPGAFGGPGDYPWRLDQGLTGSASAIQTAIGGLRASGGADVPEAYNRAYYETSHDPTLVSQYDPNAPRFLVVLGDSYGHDPNQAADFGLNGSGNPICPATGPIDPGRDNIVGNGSGSTAFPTDLGTLPSLSDLVANHTNLSFVTYNPSFGPTNKVECQMQMAQYTGGSEVTHDAGTASLGTQIVNLINQAAARVDSVTFSVTGSGPADPSNWISFFPTTLGPATAPVDIPFSETVSVPQNAAIGAYTINVAAVVDGVRRATQTLTLNVVGDAVTDVHLSVDETSLPAGVSVAPFSQIPASRIPYFAGASTAATPYGSTPYGSTPFGSTPFGSTPYGSTPWGSTPYGSTPYGSTPYGSTPFGSTPWGSTPWGSTGLGASPFGSTPYGSTSPQNPLNQVLLSQIPLSDPSQGATWPQVLGSSPLGGSPLNATNLGDVARDTTVDPADGKTPWQRFAALPARDVPFLSSLWQGIPVGAVVLGNAKLSQIPVPQGLGASDWPTVIQNSGGCNGCVTGDNTFFGVAAAGALGNTNIGVIPFGSTPYGSTAGGAITLSSMNIAGSRLGPVKLSSLSVPGDIVDCSKISCGATAGKTLADAAAPAVQAILPSATLAKLLDGIATATDPAAVTARQITVNEIVAALLPLTAYPWEQLPVQGLQDVVGTGKNGHYHVKFALRCSSTSQFTVNVRLPAGFFPVPGSSTFTYGSAAPQTASDGGINSMDDKRGTSVTWSSLPGDPCAGANGGTQPVQLNFAAFAGLSLGDQPSSASVTALGVAHAAPENASVLVTENHEPNDDPPGETITADELVVGHVASSGDREYYKLSLANVAVNSRIVAFLKVPSGADLDLTLNDPSLPPVQSTPFGSTGLGSIPIPDQPVAPDNSSTTPQANTLADVPFGSTPWGSTPFGSTPFGSTASGSISQNRGSDPEQAAIVVHQSSGFATVGVSGYNGSWSAKPYVLRLEVIPPPPLPPCPARTGLATATPGTLPAPSSLPQATKTLFLVNRQRMVGLYGATATNALLDDPSGAPDPTKPLNVVAARPEVQGAVLSVDGNANVRAAYASWDANPCSPDAANGVVRSINDLVASYRSALPNLKNIVLVGDDTILAMYRQPDPTVLAPELDEAADLAFTTNGLTQGNSLYASAAQDNILTDGAYGAFTRIPWLDHDLPLPQVTVARLVEKPAEILDQLNEYLRTDGTIQAGMLSPRSAVTTGYDFLADSADAVTTALGSSARLPGANGTGLSVDPLITHPNTTETAWTKDDIVSHFFDKTPVPDIGALFGHYNHYALQPAGPSPITDLSQVATTANAAGKDLRRHALFTVGCHSGLNVGDELAGAVMPPADAPKYLDWPQAYGQDKLAAYVANTGYGYGDTETIAAGEKLYLLFAQNLNAGSSFIGDNWLNALTTYFLGTSAYSVFDEKVMLEANFYGLPFYRFDSTPTQLPNGGTPPTSDGTVASSPYSAGFSETPGPGQVKLTKHGPSGAAWWDAAGNTLAVPYRSIQPLFTRDVTVPGFKARDVWVTGLTTHDLTDVPPLAHLIVDNSASEPRPNFQSPYWPASWGTIVRAPRPDGSERDTLALNVGQFRQPNMERLVDSASVSVTYSSASDVTRPLITQVGAIQAAGAPTATIFARATDDSGSIHKAAALYNDGRNAWGYVELQPQGGGLFTATVGSAANPLAGRIEVGAEFMDNAGNVAQSWDKASNFQAIEDTAAPSVTVSSPLPGQVFTLNQQVRPNFACSDEGGVASCVGAVLNNGFLDTSTPGAHTFTVTGTDLAGNTTAPPRTVQYVVRFVFSGFRSPVDNPPVLNLVKAGQTIPVKWALQDANKAYFRNLNAVQAIFSSAIRCPNASSDPDPATSAPGLAGLKYDLATEQYVYNWPTDARWAKSCRRLYVQFSDATTVFADFQFK